MPKSRTQLAAVPKPKRSVLSLPPTALERLLNAGTILGLVTLIGITIWGFLVAPATIPTHFNVLGKPDSYGGKTSLIALPIVGILLYVLFAVLARYPHIYNYPWPITKENAPRQYRLARTLLRWMNLFICWLFVSIQLGTIQAALSHTMQALFIVVGVLIGVIAIVISIGFYLVVAARQQ